MLLPQASLPDVDSIEEVSRERRSETRLEVVNRWRGKVKIPDLLAKFLPEDVFAWTDRAVWKDDERAVDYGLSGFGYEVTGANTFTEARGGTRIRIIADVTVHPHDFDIPETVFDKVFQAVESTIHDTLQPNLTAVARGLRSYFAAQQR